jgi:hypothetical protein
MASDSWLWSTWGGRSKQYGQNPKMRKRVDDWYVELYSETIRLASSLKPHEEGNVDSASKCSVACQLQSPPAKGAWGKGPPKPPTTSSPSSSCASLSPGSARSGARLRWSADRKVKAPGMTTQHFGFNRMSQLCPELVQEHRPPHHLPLPLLLNVLLDRIR